MYTNEIVKSYITLKEMLIDRGINVDNLDTISNEELNIMMKTNKIFSLKVNEDITVIYYTSTKFKINDLKKYLDDSNHIILIFKEKINNLNIKNIKDNTNVFVEIFMIKELQYNISRHMLVPKHEIVEDEKEIENILKTYQVKKNQLPIILRNDPMARYLDVKSGDIVKITRNSPSAGEAVLYRYCV